MNKNLFNILILFVFFTSCKTNYSFSGATVPIAAKTISVKFFENTASLSPPTLSQKFTEALRNKFSTQTRLALVSTNGDLAFEGRITDFSTAPISIQSSDQAALNRLTITVEVKYTSSFDEKKNFEQSFSRFFDYSSSQSLSSVENTLIDEINKQLVQDIFNKSMNDW